MGKAKFVSNKDETVRLFENPVLEYFSHIHPATPVVAYVPVMIWMLVLAFQAVSVLNVVWSFALGLLLWTLTEYSIHRWAFHYPPRSAWGKRIHFLVHGIHHDYPRDSTRLVMPLMVSVPLALLFYYAFAAVFGDLVYSVFAGFIIGYVAYDSIHYATHHMPMRGKIGRFLKEYHMKHHFVEDTSAYGVSNPLWDFVFKTTPEYWKKSNGKHSQSSTHSSHEPVKTDSGGEQS